CLRSHGYERDQCICLPSSDRSRRPIFRGSAWIGYRAAATSGTSSVRGDPQAPLDPRDPIPEPARELRPPGPTSGRFPPAFPPIPDSADTIPPPLRDTVAGLVG